MILVKYIEEDAAIFQIGKKMMFYFKLESLETGLAKRAVETLALVKAMAEAADKGMITAWS